MREIANVQKMDVFTFRALIPAGASGYFEKEVPKAATVERLYAQFPVGQAFALQINPVVLPAGSEAPMPLVTAAAGTDAFLAGDNTELSRDISRPVDEYDKIRVYYNNTDLANALHLVCDITIDYYGGKARVI